MLKSLIAMVGLLLFCGLAFAKTVIIADIDDTLKQSHVLNRRDMAENALRTDNPFLGMNGVLYALQKEVPAAQVYYLSTAPERLMRGQHTRFLENGHFPAGPLLMRQSLLDGNFKIVTIRKILSGQKPDQVLFIGDNSEKDTLVYAQMQQEFPQIPSRTYIHLVYSTKNPNETGKSLEAGQIGFATSFDLMLGLTAAGLIRDTTTGLFYKTYAKAFLGETNFQVDGAMAIPPWMDCRDFTWPFPLAPRTGNLLDVIREKIQGRCSIAPVVRLN